MSAHGNTGNRHAAKGLVNLSARLEIPMTPEMHADLKRRAKNAGVSVPEYCRRQLVIRI